MKIFITSVWLVLLAISANAQTVSADRFTLKTGPCTERSGSGSPEGVVTGVVCDTYHQTNSPYDIWRKVSGSGNTGWVKTTTGLTFGEALTRTNDTNVIATLGGSPTTALLNAASITLGWNGQLSVARGGTGIASLTAGYIPFGAGTSAFSSSADLTFASGALNLGTGTDLVFDTTGVAPPSFAPRSAGTRAVFYTQIGGSSADYAMGIDSNTLWSSVPVVGNYFKWYAGTTRVMELAGSGTFSIKQDILPFVNYTSNIGSAPLKFLSLSVGELLAETLVAQDVMATIGGRILVAPTTLLTGDLSNVATTITVKHNNLTNGDRVFMQAAPGGVSQVEFMAITSSASGSGGAYIYSVTRNLDGTGANTWYAGDAILNTGTTGDGYIDIYSNQGVLSGSGPSIIGNVRTGSTYNSVAPRWMIGNLNGLYGYASEIYGAAFGDASGTNVTVDATNGFRIRSSSTVKFSADTSGNLNVTGDLIMGTAGVFRSGATAYGTGTGYWLDYNSGTPRFRVGTVSGNRIDWNGTDVTIKSANFSATSTGVTVAPGTTQAFDDLHGYVFGALPYGGSMGLYAYQAAGMSYLTLSNAGSVSYPDARLSISANAPSKRATIEMIAGAPGSITNWGNSRVYGNLAIDSGTIWGYGDGPGNLSVAGTLGVTGAATLSSTLGVTGAATFSSTVAATGAFSSNVTTGYAFLAANAGTNSVYALFGSSGGWGYFGLDNSSNTTFGGAAYAQTLYSTTTGGIALMAAHGSGEIRFMTAGTMQQRMDTNGDLVPAADGTRRVGVATVRYEYMKALAFLTADIVMENDFAFTEHYRLGIEEPGVALVDDEGELIAFFGKTGFKAKGLSGALDVDTLPYAKTTLADRLKMDLTPEIRIKGYKEVRTPNCVPQLQAVPPVTCMTQGDPIYKSKADTVPMPDPKDKSTVKSTAERRGVK